MKRMAGMTLVEILVVIAIVSALTLVALPGYRGYMLRAHRTDATAALLTIAAAQEVFYLRNNTYSTQLTVAPPDGLGLQSVSANGYFELAIDIADTDSFKVIATATGGQTDDTRCLELKIDQAGTKSATSPDCWPR